MARIDRNVLRIALYELRISGESDSVARAAAVLERMQKKLRRQDWLSVEDVGTAIGEAREQEAVAFGIRSGERAECQGQ